MEYRKVGCSCVHDRPLPKIPHCIVSHDVRSIFQFLLLMAFKSILAGTETEVETQAQTQREVQDVKSAQHRGDQAHASQSAGEFS